MHHSYDSPVYSAYGVDAGDQHLHQKWRYLFVYHDLVVAEIRALRDRLADPARYRLAMRTRVLPELAELDDKLAVSPGEPGEAQKMIRELIRGAGGKKRARKEQLEVAGG